VDAIPYLLKWICYETPPWKREFYRAINRILERVKPSWALSDQNDLRAEGAKEAFGLLATEAQSAVRELGRLANDPKTSRAAADRAVVALGYIGKEALPSLLAVLMNKERGSVRASAAKRIEDRGINALPAAPVILKCLRDDEESVAVVASDILSALPLDPALVLPRWIECLQDSRFSVRRRAILYLQVLGSKAGPAVPGLVRLLHDEDPEIRAAAINALQRVQPDALENDDEL
jgi:HEAT repeat protein